MTYRFLPWTRRGLASRIRTPDTGDDGLGARAEIPVSVRVNELEPVSRTVRIYGPGDVIGVDPKVIIRVEPKRFVGDFPPNHLATVEFDAPDFCWMFTPAAADDDDRLRPWLVLVVVEQREGVAIDPSVRRPLPALTIESPADPAAELPDLSESWAWAHTQVITENDSRAEIVEALEAGPKSSSRLLCPRRLRPNTRYFACLVPGFEVGRRAGLGQAVDEGSDLAPAWRSGDNAAGTVVLPLYFHWEFATGTGGDFEDLVDRLEARPVASDAGTAPMFLGNAGPGLSPLAADDPAAVVGMEGALRAPSSEDPARSDISIELQTELEEIVNAPDEHLEAGTPSEARPVGPPLYGSHHLGEHRIDRDRSRPWFVDVNLDPRMRAAAALGTEVVRANQEELMAEAWSQVGEIKEANRALNWAQLSRAVGKRVHERHIRTLDTERALKVLAPWHRRVKSGTVTVQKRLVDSRIPDAIVDPAFRRASSSQNRTLKHITRRLVGGASGRARAAPFVDVDLVEPINDNRLRVEDLSTLPDGLFDTEAFDRLSIPPRGTEPVDMGPIGGAGSVPADVLRRARAELQAAQRLPRDPPLEPRLKLESAGVIGEIHLERALAIAGDEAELTTVLDGMVTASELSPGAIGLLVEVDDDQTVSVVALDVDRKGRIATRPRDGASARPLAWLDHNLARLRGATLGEVVGRLPANTVASRPGGAEMAVAASGESVPTLERVVGTPLWETGGARLRGGPAIMPPGTRTITVPLPVRESGATTEVAAAIRAHAALVDKPVPIPAPPVPLPIRDLRDSLLVKSYPATVVARRMRARLVLGEHRQVDELGPILAGPRFKTPMYKMLASYAREFLLPGAGQIPPDTITLLQTNPRFVEAFLLGLNVEMNRELLWREYPADRRGTAFRRFWDRTDAGDDIPPIHAWAESTSLGDNLLGGIGDQIVLLVRGELLRRYPNTVIFAAASTDSGKISDDPALRREPTLRGRFDPDFTFVGFDLDLEELRTEPGWYFVLQEQPSEPRFGLDAPAEGDPVHPPHWFDATWDQAGVAHGEHLVLEGNPLTGVTRDGARFAANAAHIAKILMQQPVMVAVHADLALKGLT